jgi:hypothetical protein
MLDIIQRKNMSFRDIDNHHAATVVLQHTPAVASNSNLEVVPETQRIVANNHNENGGGPITTEVVIMQHPTLNFFARKKEIEELNQKNRIMLK